MSRGQAISNCEHRSLLDVNEDAEHSRSLEIGQKWPSAGGGKKRGAGGWSPPAPRHATLTEFFSRNLYNRAGRVYSRPCAYLKTCALFVLVDSEDSFRNGFGVDFVGASINGILNRSHLARSFSEPLQFQRGHAAWTTARLYLRFCSAFTRSFVSLNFVLCAVLFSQSLIVHVRHQ